MESDAMPLSLEGGCRCGAVVFRVDSHTPVPYQLCYCRICRKTAGGGGYAINLGADKNTLKISGHKYLSVYRARIEQSDGSCEKSTGERNFCSECASALWLFDPNWPDLVHPFASAIDTDLPTPPERVHLMLAFKANWVTPRIGEGDQCFDLYPEESLEDWHRARDLYVS